MENVPISPGVLQLDALRAPWAPPPTGYEAGDVKWRGGNGGGPLILAATCYMAPQRLGGEAEDSIWGEITRAPGLSGIWIRVLL